MILLEVEFEVNLKELRRTSAGEDFRQETLFDHRLALRDTEIEEETKIHFSVYPVYKCNKRIYRYCCESNTYSVELYFRFWYFLGLVMLSNSSKPQLSVSHMF